MTVLRRGEDSDVRIFRTLDEMVEVLSQVETASGTVGAVAYVGFSGIGSSGVETVLGQAEAGVYLTEVVARLLGYSCNQIASGTLHITDFAGVHHQLVKWHGIPESPAIPVVRGASVGESTKRYAKEDTPEVEGVSEEVEHSIDAFLGREGDLWLGAARAEDGALEAVLDEYGIVSDSRFRAARPLLPLSVRRRLEAVRRRTLADVLSLETFFRWGHLLPQSVSEMPVEQACESSRMRTALLKAGVGTISDLWKLSVDGVRHLRGVGKKSITCLHDGLLDLVVSYPFEEGDRASVVNAARETFATRWERACKDIDERDLRILLEWIGAFGEDAPTLEAIAAEMGITRERVRQLRNRGLKGFTDAADFVVEAATEVERLLNNRTRPLYLDVIAAESEWFRGYPYAPLSLGSFLKVLLDDRMSLHAWLFSGRPVLGRISRSQYEKLPGVCLELLRNKVGADLSESHAKTLVTGIARSNQAREFADLLWKEIQPSLHFLSGDPSREATLQSVGRSRRAMVEAVLQTAEKPLPIRELAERIGKMGYEVGDTYSDLNALRNTVDQVGGLIFGRSTYGLPKHLPWSLSVQVEIAESLEALVRSGPDGRQYHTEELNDFIIDLMPEIDDESDPYVVNLILKLHSDLQYLGRRVWASPTGGHHQQDRREVARLCEAALVQAGKPLSKKELRESIEDVRGLNRHFLPQVSDRVIRLQHGTWGLIDRDVGVDPTVWRALLDELHSLLDRRGTALHVTEIVGALEGDGRLYPDGLDPHVLMGLAQADDRFWLAKGQLLGRSSWDSLGRLRVGEAFEQLLSELDRPIHQGELHQMMSDLLGRPITTSALASRAARFGMVYDHEAAMWLPPDESPIADDEA